MLDKIAIILQQECKLQANDLLLVGVSGGPDSLCLLHVLHQNGYQVIAAHLNHKLRLEADEEAHFVGQFANQLGIKFITCEMDVKSFASENSLSIEEAARIIRYRYLFDQAENVGAGAVLVAHNADDQVETVLMHLVRGAGIAGLRGMDFRTIPNPWSEKISLVRPLLSTWREEIIEYLAENEIHPVIDRSNLDSTYFRNRLRHELLPILAGYNPRIRESLLRTSQIMRDDFSVIEKYVMDAWDNILVKHGPGYLSFQRSSFTERPRSIQRYLLRKAIAYLLPGLLDVDFDCIERGLNFISSTTHGQVDLVAELSLTKDGSLFWITTKKVEMSLFYYPMVNPTDSYSLNIPSTISLNNSWKLYAERADDIVMARQMSLINQDPYQAWLDVDQIVVPLTIRSRKNGDRIQPIGMGGHSMKVSDVMINLKLQQLARKTWPLVCSGEKIVWIPGYRQSVHGQIKPESISIIHLSLFRNISA